MNFEDKTMKILGKKQIRGGNPFMQIIKSQAQNKSGSNSEEDSLLITD